MSPFLLRIHELLRLGRAAAEEELLHLLDQEFARLRVDRRQAILVEQHRLVLQPALPGFLGNVLVDTLPELAGVRRIVEAFGFDAEHHAFHRSCHDLHFSLRHTMRSRAVAVATSTPSSSRSSPAVSALRSSRDTSRLVAVKLPSFAGFRNDTFRFAVSAVESAGSTA